MGLLVDPILNSLNKHHKNCRSERVKDNFTEHLYGVVSCGSSLPPPFSIVTVRQVLYLTVSSGAGEPSPGVYMIKSWLSWILVPFPGSDFSTT